MAYTSETISEKIITSPDELPALRAAGGILWLNVDGLGDADVIRRIGDHFGLHPLALEDVVNTHQRPKVESYDHQLFFIIREVMPGDPLHTDQISLFLGQGFVVSFQEHAGDCFDPVRQRLRDAGGRFRREGRGADHLLYALIDAVIDSYFPVVERLGEHIGDLEDRILSRPCQSDIARLHQLKRDLFILRRIAWPLREALSSVVRDHHPCLADETRMYFRDCIDHTIQIIDLIETDRELCSDLRDIYLTAVSNRLNQVMKLLTIISTIFIPLTFLAGVYGMNFDPAAGPLSMPELLWEHGYVAFWIVSLLIAVGLLALFGFLGWLGKGEGT